MRTTPKRLPPLTLPPDGIITKDQWRAYVSPTLEDTHGELETYGPWSLPVRYVAPCITYVRGEFSSIKSVTLYGPRTLSKLTQAGYHLEGRLSLLGRTTTGFTSSRLFKLPDGRLLETAVIHARMSREAQ